MHGDFLNTLETFRASMLDSLRNNSVAALLWQAVNARTHALSHDVWQPFNVRDELFRRAVEQSAQYIEETMASDSLGNTNSLFNKDFSTLQDLLNASLNRSVAHGLYLEFGVFPGGSISHIAGKMTANVHRFDSLGGLAGAHGIWRPGDSSVITASQALPEPPSNTVVHRGLFEQTLQPFLQDHPEHLSFVHLDCGDCHNTSFILEALAGRMIPGTVIQFNEFFNYPGWQTGDYQAFTEFAARHALRFEFIGYVERANCMALRVVSMDNILPG